MSKSKTGNLRLADRITVNTVVLQNVALWETGKVDTSTRTSVQTALQIKTALLNRDTKESCRRRWGDVVRSWISGGRAGQIYRF